MCSRYGRGSGVAECQWQDSPHVAAEGLWRILLRPKTQNCKKLSERKALDQFVAYILARHAKLPQSNSQKWTAKRAKNEFVLFLNLVRFPLKSAVCLIKQPERWGQTGLKASPYSPKARKVTISLGRLLV